MMAQPTVTESCLRLAALTTQAAMWEDILGAFLTTPDPCANADLVAYLSDRLSLSVHGRYRRDRLAFRRLACEMVTTTAELCRRAPPLEQVHRSPAVIRTDALGRLLDRHGTREVSRILEGLRPESVDALLRVRDFEIEVPVPQVARHVCKDPLWLGWLALTECCEYKSKTLERYVRNLFTVYTFRFRRGQRRQRACLLAAAMRAAATGITQHAALDTRLVGEAVFKFVFAGAPAQRPGGKGGGAAPNDIIRTMLMT